MSPYEMVTIVGPTASGKTALAAAWAAENDGEIISADSRQVYRRMDIGTGKDLADYRIRGRLIPYHLIDIAEPGYKYNVFEYQRDFLQVYEAVKRRRHIPVLCGGTGLYIESVLRGYRLQPVPENPNLRERLAEKTLEELTAILAGYKMLHNTTDVDTIKRAVRAIEIEEYYREHAVDERAFPTVRSLVVGIQVERDVRRERISKRLCDRLDEGMVEEVRALLNEGIPAEDLLYYGLEYKFLTLYIIGKLKYEEMVRQLEIAIHQFAKRQMTWFRGMERRGIPIHWIDGRLPLEAKMEYITDLFEKGSEK